MFRLRECELRSHHIGARRDRGSRNKPGSVSRISPVGGSVNYAGYTTAVTFDLGGGASTGITTSWAGITSVTAANAATDTIQGTGTTYNLTALDAGNDGTVFWTNFGNIHDTTTGTITALNEAYTLNGANTGTALGGSCT